MSEEDLIANAKDKCAICLASFRNDLKDAIDSQGSPICSTDGVALKSASSEKIIALIKEINQLIIIGYPNQYPIPTGAFTIDLSYLKISGNLPVEASRTSMILNFKGSIFEEPLYLDQNITNGSCFDYATFKKETRFKVFNGATSFRNAHFDAVANFESNFGSDASFNGVRFNAIVNFIGVIFAGNTDFSSAIFSQDANFTRAVFSSKSDFKNSIFEQKGIFRKATFNHVDFTAAEFHDVADFSNTQFEAAINFTNTKFTKPIWLHEAKLHQDTSFYNAIFLSFNTEEDWRAYRTLKLKMGELRATEEEGRFFSYEQRTRGNLLLKDSRFSITGILSKIYDLTSEYGENIALPIYWLITITLFFMGMYCMIGGIDAQKGPESWITKIPPAIGLAFQNIFNPLGLFNKQAPLVVQSPWVALLSIAQSILTISVMALLLLAIRRRFHKGNGQ